MKPITILILLIAVVFASCKKDSIGPAGEPGAPGPSPTSYYFNSTSKDTISYLGLKNDFSDHDAIIVYIRTSIDAAGVAKWSALPYADYVNKWRYNFDISQDGTVTVWRYASGGTPNNTPTQLYFKAILLKGQLIN